MAQQEIESIRIPVFDEKSPCKASVESYPIVYPHRILTYLMDEVGIEVDDDEIEEFWTHSRTLGEPWAVDRPASNRHIPLGIHGDGARLWTTYNVEKVVAVYMNLILFRPASVRHSRFMLFSMPREKLLRSFSKCSLEKASLVIQCVL